MEVKKKKKKKITAEIVATTSLPVDRLTATDCNAAARAKSNGVMDRVHNQACLETNLAKQNSLVTGPILDSIRAKEKTLQNDIRQLQNEKANLLEKLHSRK